MRTVQKINHHGAAAAADIALRLLNSHFHQIGRIATTSFRAGAS